MRVAVATVVALLMLNFADEHFNDEAGQEFLAAGLIEVRFVA
jgi:hypothetical protein